MTTEFWKKIHVLKLFSVLRKHISLLILVLALSLVTMSIGLLQPLIMREIIDKGVLGKDYSMLFYLSIILVILHISNTVFSLLRNYFNVLLSERVAHELRVRLFEKALELGHELENIMTGDIIARLLSHINRLRDFLVNSFQTFLLNTISLIGMIIIVFSMNISLSLIILSPIPIYLIGLLLYQSRIVLIFSNMWSIISRLSSYSVQIIQSLPIVKIFGKDKYEKERFKKFSYSVLKARIDATLYNLKTLPWLNLLLTLTSTLVIYYGGIMVIRNEISLGTLTAFLAYMWQVYGPIRSLTNIVTKMSNAEAAYQRLQDFFEAEPSITDRPGSKDYKLSGEIKISNLWFGYRKNKPIIKKLSLHINKGEVVGIVGPNGAGKTTLIRLLSRFIEPWKGKILFDNIEIKNIKIESLRRQLKVVTQETILVPGSVAQNIGYGSKNELDPIVILKAGILSLAHKFVMQMPLAYDSDIGEQGKFLSGGQKQLISIARAIVSRPKILILDEATSNIHVDLEREILTNILGLLKDSTIILVSHRPTLKKFCNRILYLNDGRIKSETMGSLTVRPKNVREIPVIKGKELYLEIDNGRKLLHIDNLATLKDFRIEKPFPISYPMIGVISSNKGIFIIDDIYSIRTNDTRALYSIIKTDKMIEVKNILSVKPLTKFAINIEILLEDGKIIETLVRMNNIKVNKDKIYIVSPKKVYVINQSSIKDKKILYKIKAISVPYSI